MENHISPPIIEHKKDEQHIPMEVQILALDRHKNVAGLNYSSFNR